MKWPDLTFLKMTTVNISTDMKGFIYYIPGILESSCLHSSFIIYIYIYYIFIRKYVVLYSDVYHSIFFIMRKNWKSLVASKEKEQEGEN